MLSEQTADALKDFLDDQEARREAFEDALERETEYITDDWPSEFSEFIAQLKNPYRMNRFTALLREAGDDADTAYGYCDLLYCVAKAAARKRIMQDNGL